VGWQQPLYGDPIHTHAGVDKSLCGKLIKHVHKYLEGCISRDDELEGSLDDVNNVIVPVDDPFDDVDDEAEAQELDIKENDYSEEEEEEEGED